MGIHAAKSIAIAMAVLIASQAIAQNAFVNFESPQVSPLVLSDDGRHLLAVNSADNRIEVFGVDAAGLPSHQRSIAVDLEPVSVRLRSSSEAWVVNRLSDSISIVDIESGRLLGHVDTGDEPADVIFAGRPARAFVTLSASAQVQVFSASAPFAQAGVIELAGREPRALARSADGSEIYIAFFESGNSSTALSIPIVSDPGGPYAGLNPPPNAGTSFVPAINPNLPAPPPVAQIVRKDAVGRWRDDNGRDWSALVGWDVLDNDVAILDANGLTLRYAPRLMTMVMGLGVAANGRVVTVGTELHNEVRFEPNVQSAFVRSTLASFDPATPAIAQIADLNPQLDYSVPRVDPAVRELAIGDPRAVVIDALRNEWFVAGMGSNNVIVTNAAGTRLGRIDVGSGPTGLALSADGRRLYVLNRFDASISTLDPNARTELDRLAFFDPTPDTIKLGRPLLYDTHASSGLGQAACASCHVDARVDGLAWDLGDPSGDLKAINQPCRPNQICDNWHPMKGPLVTQTLQGIVGSGAMHWRGDREDVAAFAPAFVGLQGADAEPSAAQMQQLEAFIATIVYPPNPNRASDGSLLASMAVNGGNGDPQSGQVLFETLPVLAGGLSCADCHALPLGTNGEIDNPAIAPQPLKVPQLRGLWEKTGFSFASQDNVRGFGFMSDAHLDTLAARLRGPFTFGQGNQAAQRRRDVEAFLLAFDTETPAAVGRTLAFNGSNNADPEANALLDSLVAQADTGRIALIARRQGADGGSGFVYATRDVWLSDRENQPTTRDALRSGASATAPVTFIAVPSGSQFRSGVDRDADAVFDGDERDGGSDAADPDSLPPAFCRADFDGDGELDAADRTAFEAAHAQANPRANWDRSFDAVGLPTITPADLTAYIAAFDDGCVSSDVVFANGFD